MDGDGTPDAKTVRYLKTLVTVLTVTMIAGVLTVVGLLVMRFAEMNRLSFPDSIVLPDGETAAAFTQGEGWYAVVTAEQEILIFNRVTGELRQRIEIDVD